MDLRLAGKDWWHLPTGPLNAITDVLGVRVGHKTLYGAGAATGVTAIVPSRDNLFLNKLPAGASVINGFGKSCGVMQVLETGELETPILLTNTFGVSNCTTTLIKSAIKQNPEIGRNLPTVNPVVFECNDGQLNDIQAFHVTPQDASEALENATTTFEQGTIGAGTGMRSFNMAGGIGSASRQIISGAGKTYTVGVLVLSNFGRIGDFCMFGKRLQPKDLEAVIPEKGSIIVVMATDAPLESRQLTRLSRRATPALARLGSFLGHGSGDVSFAFSTAYTLPAQSVEPLYISRLPEAQLDPLFRASVEATEEAVLNAMMQATSRPGYDGSILPTLKDYLT